MVHGLELDDWWTLTEAAEYMRRNGVDVQEGTLRVWIHRGHLPAQRDRDGRVRVRPLDVARAEWKTRKHARRKVATVT